MRQSKYTADKLSPLIKGSYSVAELLRKLKLSETGGNHRYIKARIAHLKLDTSHFTGQLWSKGKKLGANFYRNETPLEEALQKNSCYGSSKLKLRLIAAGMKKPKCELCGRSKWMGHKIPLELHHVNEDPTDNRIDNLQVLCPNCHSLQ